MRAQQGFIVGLVKFSSDLSSEESFAVDPTFTDEPVQTPSHWMISGKIALDEPIPYTPNVSWTRIKENELKEKFQEILMEHGEVQRYIPKPKVA